MINNIDDINGIDLSIGIKIYNNKNKNKKGYKELTQLGLSKKIGCSDQTISNLKINMPKPMKSILKACEVLGVDLKTLITYKK